MEAGGRRVFQTAPNRCSVTQQRRAPLAAVMVVKMCVSMATAGLALVSLYQGGFLRPKSGTGLWFRSWVEYRWDCNLLIAITNGSCPIAFLNTMPSGAVWSTRCSQVNMVQLVKEKPRLAGIRFRVWVIDRAFPTMLVFPHCLMVSPISRNRLSTQLAVMKN